MAALGGISKGSVLSKAEYLKRYLGDEDVKTSKRKKIKKKRAQTGKGMKIVDDDVDWKQLVNADMEETHEDDEEEAPVVAEVIDERPEEIKRLEEFRTSNKWKVLGVTDEESQDSQEHHGSYSTISTGDESQMQLEEMSQRTRHDSPDVSAKKRVRHDSPEFSSMRKTRHDSPDHSPMRKSHSSSRDISPQPQKADGRKGCIDSLSYSSRKTQKTHPSSLQKKCSEGSSTSGQRNDSDSDLSPPRRAGHPSQDSDLSPPRKLKQRQNSDSDLSPPRRGLHAGHNSDSDLSPPRRKSDLQTGSRMLSGGAAGLVSVEVLRKEQDENRKRSKKDYALEDESRNAATVFRDKSGKRRDLELEREEQRRKAEEKMEKDKKYAQWGKGVAQGQMQQQNVEEALKEAQKPLARHIDDVDLDRMLREQEREGDPMAGLLRKKKEKDSNRKGVREKPRYKGPPPPPNRFNIMPGYRWDGVDRSNGFEKKRYSRMADQKAVQEMAYKWSVEDM